MSKRCFGDENGDENGDPETSQGISSPGDVPYRPAPASTELREEDAQGTPTPTTPFR